jgi:hypothetical protein
MSARLAVAAGVLLIALAPIDALAQRGRGGAQGPPPTARAVAPIDLTGYWVALITEDWRHRMNTAQKGDFPPGITLNPRGRELANTWDPARDEAAREQCKAYGAIGIMRLPVRPSITWADDNTLRIDIDAGEQTRLLHFGTAPPARGPHTWQGHSVAQWELPGPRGRGPRGAGQLKVVTTNLRAGYYFRNGIPYSENAVLTEYFNRVTEADGTSYLLVTAMVDDPQYMNGQWVRTVHFKREPDGSKRAPSPCSAR